MKRMTLMPVLLGLVLAGPARADDASKRAKVVELFRVMHVNQMAEQITSSVRQQMEMSMQSVPGAGQMNAEQKRLVDDYQAKVMAMVNENMSWKALEPQMIELYTSTYSEAEIEGILAFYKGPVGQSMLAKTPELTQKSMAITNAKLGALQPKISGMAEEFARQYAAAQNAPVKSGAGPAAAPK